VRDSGIGIGEQDLGRVFDLFFRSEQASRTGGLGIGLYLARQIVERHGGEIGCTSTEGKGSTFWFSIPLT
jgi:signal transduction histidine kinase